jgi:hypothetical protein
MSNNSSMSANTRRPQRQNQARGGRVANVRRLAGSNSRPHSGQTLLDSPTSAYPHDLQKTRGVTAMAGAEDSLSVCMTRPFYPLSAAGVSAGRLASDDLQPRNRLFQFCHAPRLIQRFLPPAGMEPFQRF